MELEFEMENAPMRAWLEGDVEAKAIQTTNELATQLFRLLNLCIPGTEYSVIFCIFIL